MQQFRTRHSNPYPISNSKVNTFLFYSFHSQDECKNYIFVHSLTISISCCSNMPCLLFFCIFDLRITIGLFEQTVGKVSDAGRIRDRQTNTLEIFFF
jgi:hypothetical protein